MSSVLIDREPGGSPVFSTLEKKMCLPFSAFTHKYLGTAQEDISNPEDKIKQSISQSISI